MKVCLILLGTMAIPVGFVVVPNWILLSHVVEQIQTVL